VFANSKSESEKKLFHFDKKYKIIASFTRINVEQNFRNVRAFSKEV